MDISRAELEKAKNNSHVKRQQAEDAKNAYALATQRANAQQHDHYSKLLPAALERLRAIDEDRIDFQGQMMIRCADIERANLPIIEKCLDEMKNHANRVDKGCLERSIGSKTLSISSSQRQWPRHSKTTHRLCTTW